MATPSRGSRRWRALKGVRDQVVIATKFGFASNSGFLAMNTIFNDVCVIVAAACALTLVPGFRNLERSLLSRRDQGAVMLVFTILGLVEEATVSHTGLLNERIVAVCATGLVAGPWVGLAVGVFVTWLAVAPHGLPLGVIATSMLCGGF